MNQVSLENLAIVLNCLVLLEVWVWYTTDQYLMVQIY